MHSTDGKAGKTAEKFLCFAQKLNTRSSRDLRLDIVDQRIDGKALHQPLELFGTKLTEFVTVIITTLCAIIAVCLFLIAIMMLIIMATVVPKTIHLIDTTQHVLENMEEVSEDLKALKLAETIQSIDNNTAQAMEDVSAAAGQLNELDMDALNQSPFRN